MLVSTLTAYYVMSACEGSAIFMYKQALQSIGMLFSEKRWNASNSQTILQLHFCERWL